MRTTIFSPRGEKAGVSVSDQPDWQPLQEFEGKPLEKVHLVEVLSSPGVEIQLVEIAAGGSFAMHSSPALAFCQVVHGKGKLGLPGGEELRYEAPELYLFLPETMHDWHDIEVNTLLSVCLVGQ
jgi:quercetin dioxygenase-like cupin family protein